MIARLFLFNVLLLMALSCTTDEPWESSDFFIGTWAFEARSFLCCEGCSDNYEQECERFDGPFHGEIVLNENGTCYRTWKNSGNTDTLAWCYNANTRVLGLKNEDGVFSNFEDKYFIDDIDNDAFSSEILASMLLRVTKFNKK